MKARVTFLHHYAMLPIPFDTSYCFIKYLDTKQPVECCYLLCLFALSVFLQLLQSLINCTLIFALPSVFYSQPFRDLSVHDCVIKFAFWLGTHPFGDATSSTADRYCGSIFHRNHVSILRFVDFMKSLAYQARRIL
jgi:hypothetical protein